MRILPPLERSNPSAHYVTIRLTQPDSSAVKAWPCIVCYLYFVPYCTASALDDTFSYLSASLHCLNLAELGYVRCLQRVCAVTVPSFHWGTFFAILFALAAGNWFSGHWPHTVGHCELGGPAKSVVSLFRTGVNGSFRSI